MLREPMAMYQDEQLSRGAQLLLVLLWRYIGDERSDAGTWLAVAEKRELRHDLGASRTTFTRYMRDLKDSRWLVAADRQLGGNFWTFELRAD